VAGAYVQHASAELLINIAGVNPTTDYGALNVTGTANLNGALNITLLDGFMPTPGDSFDLLVATSIVGGFSSLVLPDISGIEWELNVLTGGPMEILRLTAVPLPPAVWLLGAGLVCLRATSKRRHWTS
jgi:hypothetical protein